MTRLFTIGYESVTLEGFLATLVSAGVNLLLDVRELPISRRKGFSKTALRLALETAGIDYRHERDLGSPRVIRNKLREDGNFFSFETQFEAYLQTKTALLDSITAELEGAVALMCFERNWRECHRKIVASHLAKRTDTTVQHLQVPIHASSHNTTRTHFGQSLSAA